MPSAMREKLVRGVDSKEIAEMDKSYEAFVKLIGESNPYNFHEKYKGFQKSHPNNQKDLQNRFVLGANDNLRNKFLGRPFALKLPLPISQDEWIECKGSIGSHSFDCRVSCGHWHKLKPTDQEKRDRQLNLIDHLSELLPSQGKYVGLFTFQNGINNSFEDFKKMGNSIRQHLPEKPLCIGIYNPTKGIAHDLTGVFDKLGGCLSDTICITHQIFTTLAEKLYKINPALFWAYIAHSEGGLIAETALTMMNGRQWIYNFPQKLLVATYGAVLPIPKSYAKAINTYSSKDGATLPRVKSYLEGLGEKAEDYEIKIVDANTIDLPYLSFGITGLALKAAFERIKGDHDFQGHTYQRALKHDIDNFFRGWGHPIYDGK